VNNLIKFNEPHAPQVYTGDMLCQMSPLSVLSTERLTAWSQRSQSYRANVGIFRIVERPAIVDRGLHNGNGPRHLLGEGDTLA